MITTHVITGFLGSGKTSLIRQFLAKKPTQERWAVLVNEFGEVGVDASMLPSSPIIREVPGGCLCCAAGVPMTVALNALIEQKPDRLIIEPTGLGHPRDILKKLQAPPYDQWLTLGVTLTLVDARKLKDPRYTEHEIFVQQIQVADRLVAAKSDLYDETTLDALTPWAMGRPIVNLKPDQAELSWLEGQPQAQSTFSVFSTRSSPSMSPSLTPEPKDSGFVSQGWRFAPNIEFDLEAVHALVQQTPCRRFKATVICHQGIFAFNKVDEEMSVWELDEIDESRFEIIDEHNQGFALVEQQLQALVAG